MASDTRAGTGELWQGADTPGGSAAHGMPCCAEPAAGRPLMHWPRHWLLLLMCVETLSVMLGLGLELQPF